MPVPEPVAVFQYWNGKEQVSIDPWPTYREIFRRTGGRPNELQNKVYACTPDTTDLQTLAEGNEASEQLEQLVREVFQMHPCVNGQGAQWPHCLAVWKEFVAFMNDLKKKRATSPITSSPTAVPDSSPAILSGSA